MYDIVANMEEKVVFRGCTDCRHRGHCDNCGSQFLKCYSEILRGFHEETMARIDRENFDKT